MPRPGSYLFKQKGSQNWHLRLQFPAALAKDGKKKIERSLGTPDRAEAEIRAADAIRDHKKRLLLRRNIKRGTPFMALGAKFEPGKSHPLPHGGSVIATDTQLIYLDENGNILRTEQNGEALFWDLDEIDATADEKKLFFEGRTGVEPIRKTHKRVDAGDAFIETWIQHNNIEPYMARETRENWATFKRLVNNKPLSSCTRDDGRKLVAHFREARCQLDIQYHLLGHEELTVAKGYGYGYPMDVLLPWVEKIGW